MLILSRLNRLEKSLNPGDDHHLILVGYSEDQEEFELRREESYSELKAKCGGVVKGLVVFVTNYQDNFRWEVPDKKHP